MFVDGEENTLVLVNLTPMTKYIVRVYSVIGEESSAPLEGAETTREFNISHAFLCFNGIIC